MSDDEERCIYCGGLVEDRHERVSLPRAGDVAHGSCGDPMGRGSEQSNLGTYEGGSQ